MGPGAHEHDEARQRDPVALVLHAKEVRPLAQAAIGSEGERRGYFWYVATVSRQRPLRRRFCRTLAPPAVFMRARNPCVRRRRGLWGWYVRFISRAPRPRSIPRNGEREESTASFLRQARAQGLGEKVSIFGRGSPTLVDAGGTERRWEKRGVLSRVSVVGASLRGCSSRPSCSFSPA